MKKHTRLVVFVLLLFFIVGTAVVFAISEDEAYTRGYRDGYSDARIFSNDKKTYERGRSWLTFYNDFSQSDKDNLRNLKYQWDNGYEEGWTDQKDGRRPSR